MGKASLTGSVSCIATTRTFDRALIAGSSCRMIIIIMGLGFRVMLVIIVFTVIATVIIVIMAIKVELVIVVITWVGFIQVAWLRLRSLWAIMRPACRRTGACDEEIGVSQN